MLKLKYLYENYDLARTALAFYEYSEDSLDEMLSYFRISSNAIYPFYANDKVQFLRLSPVDEKSPAHVDSEIHLINWLRKNGFPAMKPVAMKTGEPAKEIHTEWGSYNVSCFALVPGENLEDTEGTLSIVEGYGRTLGTLHSLMKRYPDAEKHRDHKDLLKEIGARLEEYSAPASAKAEYQAVCGELEKLSVSSATYGVIHYDFEPDNVFYDRAEDAFHVIDFDDAIRCWYALDLVRALDALDDVIESEDPDTAASAFLEGYQSAADLTDEQTMSFPLMRRLVRLQEYATLLHVLSEPVDEMPDWMDALIKKLTNKIRQLESQFQ